MLIRRARVVWGEDVQDYRLDRKMCLRHKSVLESPWPENNVVMAIFSRRGSMSGVLVLPNWQCQVAWRPGVVCPLGWPRMGISAMKDEPVHNPYPRRMAPRGTSARTMLVGIFPEHSAYAGVRIAFFVNDATLFLIWFGHMGLRAAGNSVD